MILVDNSQILLSSILSVCPPSTDNKINIDKNQVQDLMRHVVFKTYLSIKKKFNSYGDIVLCQDAGDYWRKDVFPFYKQNRKKLREKNQEYWDSIYSSLNIIKKEISTCLNYKNMNVSRCEADDIIFTLCKNYHNIDNIIIISNDKDFKQLLEFKNVCLYSPLNQENITCSDPYSFLVEHIITGDSSDGIPNILSDDDTIITEGKRQKPVTKKKLLEWTSDMSSVLSNVNYLRNKKLIDLSEIPTEYQNKILDEYTYQCQHVSANKHQLFNYFMSNNMKELIKNINEF